MGVPAGIIWEIIWLHNKNIIFVLKWISTLDVALGLNSDCNLPRATCTLCPCITPLPSKLCETACAYCTAGSYALISICLPDSPGLYEKSGTLWKTLDNETAYALKTLHIVYLKVIILSLFFGRSTDNVLRSQWNILLTSWPWPLTYDIDLQTWPRYPSYWPPRQKSSLYVCPFSQDSETEPHTDTWCQNYYTHHVRDVGCNEDAYALKTPWV